MDEFLRGYNLLTLAISQASYHGIKSTVEIINELVEKSQCGINSFGKNGITALEIAVQNRSIPTVIDLLKCGADINLNSPLLLSITNHYPHITMLLINKGADIEQLHAGENFAYYIIMNWLDYSAISDNDIQNVCFKLIDHDVSLNLVNQDPLANDLPQRKYNLDTLKKYRPKIIDNILKRRLERNKSIKTALEDNLIPDIALNVVKYLS